MALSSELSARREVEYTSIGQGQFVTIFSEDSSASTSTTTTSGSASFRLPPAKPLAWDSERDFHPDLAVPAATNSNNSPQGLVLTWQARAREGLVVALSSNLRYQRTHIALGVSGATFCGTEIRHQHINTTVAGRVCREDAWVSYWVVVVVVSAGVAAGSTSADDPSSTTNGVPKLFVGVGDNPGEQCIAFLNLGVSQRKLDASNTATESSTQDEELEEQVNGKDDEVVAAKISKGTTTSNPVVELRQPFRYVGFRNTAAKNDRQPPKPIFLRNLKLSGMVPDQIQQQLERLPENVCDLPMIILGEGDANLSTTDQETVQLLCRYRAQCDKARRRAAKFGVVYQPPDLASTLPWSQARRLRANPASTTGFATGVDIQSTEERSKQEQRRQRFGVGVVEPVTGNGDTEDSKPEASGSDVVMDTNGDALPVEQAWDKEELVGSQRVDPPSSLWIDPPDLVEAKNEFQMEVEEPFLVPEKVHVFSIDWAAFKQIRTNDIMQHFAIYGPSYVEWLGDLSCNVLFEDKFSASRALENMSLPLPSPPPLDSETPEEREETVLRPDLGRMGWRLGKNLLRKMANDKYGRKGTEARILLRSATSLDVLHERPSGSKWPPGFTTKSVLGPNSDLLPNKEESTRADEDAERVDGENALGLPDKRQSKKKKRGRGSDERAERMNSGENKRGSKKGEDALEDLLNGPLSSGRPGFSVEEMKTQRLKKKLKPSPS